MPYHEGTFLACVATFERIKTQRQLYYADIENHCRKRSIHKPVIHSRSPKSSSRLAKILTELYQLEDPPPKATNENISIRVQNALTYVTFRFGKIFYTARYKTGQPYSTFDEHIEQDASLILSEKPAKTIVISHASDPDMLYNHLRLRLMEMGIL